MQTKYGSRQGSKVLYWLTGGALVLAALPILSAWRGAGQGASVAPNLATWEVPQALQGMASSGIPWENQREIVVQLRPGSNGDALTDVGTRMNSPLAWRWTSSRGPQTGVAQLAVPFGKDPASLLSALRADSRVLAADYLHYYTVPEDLATETQPASPTPTDETDTNRWKPNDPRYNEQWNFQMVRAEEAWEITRGKGAVVAVIDTGVASADSKKGKIARDFKDTRFTAGYDFVNKDSTPYDDQGHGTHVSGTIAESTNNKEGVAGLAFEATIMPLKVLDAYGGGRSDVIADAIRWAADHGAKVINMSLGGPMPDKVMGAACEYAKQKGVTIVCAAGNSGREGVGYPAGFKDCIAVSSVGPDGTLSFYSSWGRQVALAAPGGDKQKGGDAGGILQNTVLRNENDEVQDDYYSFQGTSMASPHVAAVAALIVSKGVTDPDDVKAILQKSAKKVNGPEKKYGAGILDAAAAAKLAAKTHGDGVARFWIVLGLFGGCFFLGHLRQKAGSKLGYPILGTLALSLGLLLPDWLSGYLGMTAHANLIGHSILLPGALLALGATGKTERRMAGWMAFGLILHLGWELLRGTTPFGAEVGFWQMLPWVTVNGVSGLGILLSGLTTKE